MEIKTKTQTVSLEEAKALVSKLDTKLTLGQRLEIFDKVLFAAEWNANTLHSVVYLDEWYSLLEKLDCSRNLIYDTVLYGVIHELLQSQMLFINSKCSKLMFTTFKEKNK